MLFQALQDHIHKTFMTLETSQEQVYRTGYWVFAVD